MLAKQHKAPPLVFLETPDSPGEYIGGLDEFLEWANSRYGYVDTTKDLIYNMKAKSDYKKYREGTGRPFVFLQLKDGFQTFDRVVIEVIWHNSSLSDRCLLSYSTILPLSQQKIFGVYVQGSVARSCTTRVPRCTE